ncbi:MAG: glycosyltransferase [Alphaproteobacteria bacterium]|nr:glycosyltransferase [Alphaproteobacteria bacterium]
MRILHIMAGRGLGGAETYSTDIMLSLHEKGVDQCIVMAADAPRYEEIVKAGIRTAPEVLGQSPSLRATIGSEAIQHESPVQETNTGLLRFARNDNFSGATDTLMSLATRHCRFFQRRALRRVLEREKPDLVHCWMRRAASLMPDWNKERTIGWFGGYYDPRHFTSCGHFVGVTKDIVEHQIRNGVPRERAHFVPTFPDVKDEPAVDRASLNTPQDAFVVLALSRLHPKKGLDTLLRAAQALPDAFVWLAGEGPLRSDLEKLTRGLDMEDRVRFLGWRMDRGALLRAADVCALPSRYEPFGTVILEAWAAGTPFVACKSAGPAAHVDDGRNGLLVDIDDVEGLAGALAHVRTDASLRQRLIAEGRKTFEAGYTREAVTARMMGLYEDIAVGLKLEKQA